MEAEDPELGLAYYLYAVHGSCRGITTGEVRAKRT